MEIDLDVPEGAIDASLKIRRLGTWTRLLRLTQMQFLEPLESRDIPYLEYTSEDGSADREAGEEYNRRSKLRRPGLVSRGQRTAGINS